MKNKRKNKLKRILYLILVIYVGYVLFQQQMYLISCKKEESYYAKEIEKQKNITMQLEQQKQVQRDKSYTERIARDKLGLVLPGEKIYVDISQ